MSHFSEACHSTYPFMKRKWFTLLLLHTCSCWTHDLCTYRMNRNISYQVRLQLESLLAEKARLAQENSVYAGENRFLREIVEYHQLTMQDVVYFDEGSEEVTEVYPIKITTPTNMQPSSASPTPTVPHGAMPQSQQNIAFSSAPSLELKESTGATNPYIQMPGDDVRKH